MTDKHILTISRAARMCNLTPTCILLAIRNNRLKAEKINNQWCFTLDDWIDYRDSLYSRKMIKNNGKLLYHPEKGLLSTKMFSEKYSIKLQAIYYFIRKEIIPAKKIKNSYVIDVNKITDIEKITNAGLKNGSGNKDYCKRRRKNTHKKILGIRKV